MYNKILKRPMFNMGGRTYQAQGTGITSGLDTPRRGLVQQPGGYAGEDTREIINTEREEIFRTPEGQNFTDIVASFGEYANPYKEDGTAKTSGEMGYLQAKNITEKRKLRKDTQDLAELEGLKSREDKIITDEKLAGDLEITKAGVRPLDVEAKKKLAGDAAELLATAKKTAKATNEPIPQHVIDEIEALNILALGSNYYSLARASQIAAEVYSTKEVLAKTSIKQRAELRKNLIRSLTGGRFEVAQGGRVGYAMGTNEMGAQITETSTMPGGSEMELSATEIATNKMDPNVQQGSGLGEGEDAFALLRARLPQEITDDIVQLIAYNPSAFEDFAQIESQEDVISFNNTYGVELVIDAQQV